MTRVFKPQYFMLPLRQHYNFRIRIIFRKMQHWRFHVILVSLRFPRHPAVYISPVNPATPDYASRLRLQSQITIQRCISKRAFHSINQAREKRHKDTLSLSYSLALYILRSLDPYPSTTIPSKEREIRERKVWVFVF